MHFRSKKVVESTQWHALSSSGVVENVARKQFVARDAVSSTLMIGRHRLLQGEVSKQRQCVAKLPLDTMEVPRHLLFIIYNL